MESLTDLQQIQLIWIMLFLIGTVYSVPLILDLPEDFGDLWKIS